MVNDYMRHKVLDKIREIIGIIRFHNTKILIDGDDKLPDCIIAVILATCIIKDNGKFFSQKLLEKISYDK